MFQLVSSATARSKREDDEDGDENLSSNPTTAPPADTDEGVVPDKDGGLFSNDSMISKPPKSLTKTSEKDKLEDMFDYGIRTEDHKEENSYDSDASSKILDESYGDLGYGSKWYKYSNGPSRANSYASQDDKKRHERC